MKPKTKFYARNVQSALVSLSPEIMITVIERELEKYGERECLDCSDDIRFFLGWQLEDNNGKRYGKWPQDPSSDLYTDLTFIRPEPETLLKNIAGMHEQDFYHQALPLFQFWSEFETASPPSSFSDGYAWMENLSEWLKSLNDTGLPVAEVVSARKEGVDR